MKFGYPSDPRVLREVGYLVFHESFRIAILSFLQYKKQKIKNCKSMFEKYWANIIRYYTGKVHFRGLMKN